MTAAVNSKVEAGEGFDTSNLFAEWRTHHVQVGLQPMVTLRLISELSSLTIKEVGPCLCMT